MDIDIIYNEDCLQTMIRMSDEFIDLTVTSPPYDNLRTYNGYSFDFEHIARELYRVTKQGGIVVWIVGDATIKGSETGTSFRQALYFKEIGFNLHDTMIYRKLAGAKYGSLHGYRQSIEFMFILVKGKIKTFNPIRDKHNIHAGEIKTFNKRLRDGTFRKEVMIIKDYGARDNVWEYMSGNSRDATDKIAHQHPAIFPEQLASDHIISWSNEGDIVYDPFMGSGTTAKMAILNNRHYIGSEISKKYCEIAPKRLAQSVMRVE